MVKCKEALLETHFLNLFMDNLEMEEQLLIPEHEKGVSTNVSQNYNKLQCLSSPAQTAK